MSTYAPIGLTGGIASGKSTVAGLFRAWGAFVADADRISRHALDPGTACYDRTVTAFGRDILRQDGTVDRKKVASIVFSDPQALAILNGIIHPYVHEVILKESEKAFLQSPRRLIVWDVPLLFEAGYEAEVAGVVVVTARQSLRIQRIVERDGSTKAAALRRIRSQMPDREKVRRADIVIRNNGSREELEQRTREVFDELMETMDRRS
ncbi:MAG: dephospho-CoA kinase [Clostridia bacterium]|nr:dephospho-CoA kinase [Clostridia bacterium]